MDLGSLINSLEQNMVYNQAMLKNANENNKKKKALEDDYLEQVHNADILKAYLQGYGILLRMSQQAALEYRETKISQLEETIENVLELVLPQEHFRVKIEFTQARGETLAQLLVGHIINGEFVGFYPRCKNGGFVQQLISLSAIAAINLMKGSNILFMDEALSSGDSVNLSNLKPFIDEMLHNGLEILTIEHKESLYTGIDRNEIILLKDRESGKVIVSKIEEKSGV